MDQQRKMRSGYCQDWALTKRMMYLQTLQRLLDLRILRHIGEISTSKTHLEYQTSG